MCKVLGVAGVSEKNRGDVIKFLKAVTPKLCTVERDGFGYAAIDASGNVFGEKWLEPEHAWLKRIKRKHLPAVEVTPKVDKPVLDQFESILENYAPMYHQPAPPIYDTFGERKLGEAVAFVLHSRFGTNGSKKIEHVHPFVAQETAMVHNGIVYNDDAFFKVTDCDSEVLLHLYNERIVNMDCRGIEEALEDVQAYLACLVLSQTIDAKDNMVPILDIFKADAQLSLVHVHELGVTFFCTEGRIVIETCKELGLSSSRAFNMQDEVLVRLHAATGEILEKEEFSFNGTYKYGYNMATGKWGSQEEKTYLMSKYGEDWEQHRYTDEYEDACRDEWDDDVPNHKEYKSKYDTDEPDYRKEAKEASGGIYDATKGATTASRGFDILEKASATAKRVKERFKDPHFCANDDEAKEIFLDQEERQKVEDNLKDVTRSVQHGKRSG